MNKSMNKNMFAFHKYLKNKMKIINDKLDALAQN